MEIIKGIDSIEHVGGPTAVTIGVFDGVHLGHQTIIRKAIELAASIDGKSVVVTFDPHPLAIVRPGSEPALLTSTELKAEYISELGADFLLVIPFSGDIANMEAKDFVDDVLLGKLHARHVVIGEDFSFGKHRQGTVDFLRAYGAPKGLDIVAVEHVRESDTVISSTEVRKRLKEGDIEGVRALTGRYPKFRGRVARGFGRGGSIIGFPTANIETFHNELTPRPGVYAGYALTDGERYPCVIDIGWSPTFGDLHKAEIHVHILGFNKDIYGNTLDVEIQARLRDEMTFSGVEELKANIRKDIERAKDLLANRP